MDDQIRRSKIYSYFYGKNTVFQQFIIVVGIVIALFTSSYETNRSFKIDELRSEYETLKEDAAECYSAYKELYNDYSWDFDVELEESATIYDNDEYEEEKLEYNNALEKYQDAKSDADSAYVKYYREAYGETPDSVENSYDSYDYYDSYSSYGSSYSSYSYGHRRSSDTILWYILGGGIAIIGLMWIILKKIFPNKKEGEEAVDTEVQIRMQEAKNKALSKLNIVAEQVEKVEPVMLCGIANQTNTVATLHTTIISKIFHEFFKRIVANEAFIIGAIFGAVYLAITELAARHHMFYAALILFFILAAGIGYLLFKKYEVESYVSERTIRKLERVEPKLIVKLGTDDCIRVSLPAITVYMFGNDQLYMYYQYIDIVTGKIFCEGVHEYFYEDIVAITSEQKIKKTFKRGGCLNLRFTAIDYLRESITVNTSGCEHTEAYIVPVGSSLLDTRFIGMRNLVREKKAEK